MKLMSIFRTDGFLSTTPEQWNAATKSNDDDDDWEPSTSDDEQSEQTSLLVPFDLSAYPEDYETIEPKTSDN